MNRRNKHIDIAYHFVRDAIRREVVYFGTVGYFRNDCGYPFQTSWQSIVPNGTSQKRSASAISYSVNRLKVQW